MDFADINVRLLIAGSLVMIVALLAYIAFFKDSDSKRSRK